ncbi:hypothetical protein TcWFU_007796 [Taenia crassiceps]|uniref:Uncharacterized protein n=1 Tax=Taenia crassiceps TaxID=6207 RepID=A0ABR4Q0X5_9CEST
MPRHFCHSSTIQVIRHFYLQAFQQLISPENSTRSVVCFSFLASTSFEKQDMRILVICFLCNFTHCRTEGTAPFYCQQ